MDKNTEEKTYAEVLGLSSDDEDSLGKGIIVGIILGSAMVAGTANAFQSRSGSEFDNAKVLLLKHLDKKIPGTEVILTEERIDCLLSFFNEISRSELLNFISLP